jgi:hypothetical protein
MECKSCAGETVTAFCRECGRGVCGRCIQTREGVVYCSDCGPGIIPAAAEALEEVAAETETPAAAATSLPPPATPPHGAAAPLVVRPRQVVNQAAPHPVLAGLLGLAPGLGAVYNGQYVKGVIHVVLFGILLTIMTEGPGGLEILLGLMTALLVLYMPIEAVRTAQAMRRGEPVDEVSGLLGQLLRPADRSPAAGVLLIALGVLLLLFSLGFINIRTVLPAWPALIVVYGIYRLYRSLRPEEPRPEREP